MTSNRRRRSAFTLLEILLTLSLSVVLMMLIGGAMQFYAGTLNSQDLEIRQVQLASAMIQMIEDDLRATQYPQPIDTSGLEQLFASLTGGSGGGSSAGVSGGEDLSAAGIGMEEDFLIDDVDSSALDLQLGASVLQNPGLIGNQYQIQIDLSRIPRLEEYMVMMDASLATIDDIPSDLKTVTYFVQPAGTVAGVADPFKALAAQTGATVDPEATTSGGGLVRRSLDRAATVQALNSGAVAMLNQTGDLLAPEIIGIEFAYWDGMMWLIEWNSDEFGALPLAVQVKIYMNDPSISDAEATTAAMAGLANTDSLRVFTHIVRLPLARPVDLLQDETAEVGYE